mmetsp:Transcript_1465/g.3543  ORF Transcript_1465/g.3543 Transcript_1465/m.3543 type:complete len:321 (+) Transcript_1465:86-1048(+)
MVASPPRETSGYSSRSCNKGAMGPQALSHRSTSPVSHFKAYSDRGQASKQFISPSHTQAEFKGRAGPGPGIYNVRGAFFDQYEAQKRSPPKYSFGREERWKPASETGLGPGVNPPPSSLGPQALSSRMSPPKACFGTSTREQASKQFVNTSQMGLKKGTIGPDPGHYNARSSVGPQATSNRPNAPAFTQPKRERLKDDLDSLSRSLPPPSKHSTWKDTTMAQSLGKQAESKFRTLPAYKFGTASHKQDDRRFYTLPHTRALKGLESPANYDHQTAANTTGFGPQILSSKASPAGCSFGTAPRAIFKPFKLSSTPGPGAYE